jgi:predicted protein tyrosine phosphatase
MAVHFLWEAHMGTHSLSISRRLALALAALLFGKAAAPRAPVNVLFVCQAGTVKSPVAREHFRRLAKAGGTNAQAQSRGITPEDHMTPKLAAALKADGINVDADPVLPLTVADLKAADVIVVFNALPAQLGTWKVRNWSDLPSMNENYAVARAILLPRLEALSSEIG